LGYLVNNKNNNNNGIIDCVLSFQVGLSRPYFLVKECHEATCTFNSCHGDRSTSRCIDTSTTAR